MSTSRASKSGEATQSRTISSSDASEVAQNSWYRSFSKYASASRAYSASLSPYDRSESATSK